MTRKHSEILMTLV